MPTTPARRQSRWRNDDRVVGEWPNRDPLGEGGFALIRNEDLSIVGTDLRSYAFVGNSPLNSFDSFGLKEYGTGYAEYQQCLQDCQSLIPRTVENFAHTVIFRQ